MILAISSGSWAGQYEIVPGELVVKLRPTDGAISAQSSPVLQFFDLCEKTGAKQVKGVGGKDKIGTQAVSGPRFYRLSYSPSADVQALADQFMKIDGVQYAEPVHYVYASQSVSDPVELAKTDLTQIQNIPAKHPIIVAVVDSGVDYNHDALAGQIALNSADTIDGIDSDKNGYVDDYYGYNLNGNGASTAQRDPMDEYGHGTHIAGIIAARKDSEYPGINPDAKILDVRFLDERGRGTDAAGAEAIYYSVDRGAKIINCSWGYFTPSQTLQDAINYAAAHNVIVVAAAGNDNSLENEYPAAFDSVIAVGSVNADHSRSSFSNYGAYLDFMEVGRRVMGLKPGNGTQSLSGTSQASAVMSGIISRILGFDNSLTPNQVYEIVKSACIDLDRPGKDILTGNGLLDPATLVAKLTVQSKPSTGNQVANVPTDNSTVGVFSVPLTVSKVMNYPNPIRSDSNQFGLQVSDAADVHIDIYNEVGRKVRGITSSVSQGYNSIAWAPVSDDGSTLANGTYYYVVAVTAAGQTQRKKGMLSIVR